MQSMTGFGRAEGNIGGSHLTIEIKSVNHRFLDARFRIPSFLSSLELSFSQALRDEFQRGSFDCSIRHRVLGGSESPSLTGTRFVVDEAAAQSFKDSCDWLATYFKTEKLPSLEAYLLSGKIIVPSDDTESLSEKFPEILKIFQEAMGRLKKSRLDEGARIRDVLLAEAGALETLGSEISKLAAAHPETIREELHKRIASWKLTHEVDAQRLETEIAFLADRADMTEELDRLASHLKEFRGLLQSKEPVGRKLDFYTQELHRELNTMGSKTPLAEVTRLVVTAKSSVEKLRQQVQNVE